MLNQNFGGNYKVLIMYLVYLFEVQIIREIPTINSFRLYANKRTFSLHPVPLKHRIKRNYDGIRMWEKDRGWVLIKSRMVNW